MREVKKGKYEITASWKEAVEDEMWSQRWNVDMSQPQISGGLRVLKWGFLNVENLQHTK